eukprot:7386291-Prymnesium_polylepis.1
MRPPGMATTVQRHRGLKRVERTAHAWSDWGVLDVVAGTHIDAAKGLVLRCDTCLVEFALACSDCLVGALHVTAARRQWHVSLEEHVDPVVLHQRRHLICRATRRTREQLHDLRGETRRRLIRSEEPAREEGQID